MYSSFKILSRSTVKILFPNDPCPVFSNKFFVIREALKQLELEGLVKSIPNKGVYVLGFSHRDIDDMLEIRYALEGLAIQFAIERINDEELKKIKEVFFVIIYPNFLMIAAVNSSVEAFPPISGVIVTPSSTTAANAAFNLFASSNFPSASNINIKANNNALGVLGLSHRDIDDMLEIRYALEGLAIQFAIERINDEELKKNRFIYFTMLLSC